MNTYRDAFEGAGVEGPVDLGGDVVVVVVEVLQASALGLQGGHGLVEGQGQSPDRIIGQRGLLEPAGVLGVLPPQTRHQGGDELLRRLKDTKEESLL